MQRRKGEEGDPAEEEERSVSIISNLLQGVSRGTRRDRICAKFLENEFEKCDRLMELYDQYEVRPPLLMGNIGLALVVLVLMWSGKRGLAGDARLKRVASGRRRD